MALQSFVIQFLNHKLMSGLQPVFDPTSELWISVFGPICAPLWITDLPVIVVFG